MAFALLLGSPKFFLDPRMIVGPAKIARILFITAASLSLAVPSPSHAQGGHVVVRCLDEHLGTVQETLASDCEGRAVPEDEAAAIRSQRRDYIRKVLSKVPDSRLEGKKLASVGSGFFIADDGSVLTSQHLVDDCSGVSVAPSFGPMALATAVVPAEQADLALLRTDVAPPGVAAFAEDGGSAVMGSAFVAGYPEQGLVSVAPILSAVEILLREDRTPRGPAIVVRGDIKKGNSGGPLLDTAGNVIGVVVAKVDTIAMYKATGEVVRDIGFALPGNRVRRFLEAQSVRYRESQGRPLQPEDRLLEDSRAFMVRVGCWR